jgi:hypothetical protein
MCLELLFAEAIAFHAFFFISSAFSVILEAYWFLYGRFSSLKVSIYLNALWMWNTNQGCKPCAIAGAGLHPTPWFWIDVSWDLRYRLGGHD